MVSLYDGGIYLVNGKDIIPEQESVRVEALTGKKANKEAAKKGTIAYSILSAHNTADNMEQLKLRFDSMASHDITFVPDPLRPDKLPQYTLCSRWYD